MPFNEISLGCFPEGIIRLQETELKHPIIQSNDILMSQTQNFDSRVSETRPMDGFDRYPQDSITDEGQVPFYKNNPSMFEDKTNSGIQFDIFESQGKDSLNNFQQPSLNIMTVNQFDQHPSRTSHVHHSTDILPHIFPFPGKKVRQIHRFSKMWLNQLSEGSEYSDSRCTPDHSIVQNQGHINQSNSSMNVSCISKDADLTPTDSELKFMKHISSFTTINGHNFKELLVKILRECLHQISPDDVYNLLYNYETPNQVISSLNGGSKTDNYPDVESKLEGLNLCHLALEIFRSSDMGSQFTSHLSDIMLVSVNFQEVCKNFLAIKIILDSVKTVADTSKSGCYLPRASVYKAYYILSKKLMQKYSMKLNFQNLQSNLMLNQSQLGKIINLSFPNLIVKRFGKRGESTYHYQGLIWNNSVINEDVKLLLDLSLSSIESTLARKQNKRVIKLNKIYPNFESGENNLSSTKPKEINKLFTKKPVHSFVLLSSILPSFECPLRDWESVPGKLPQQSKWSRETMQKSVEVLQNHGIEVKHLVSNINKTSFCAETVDKFFEDVLLKIRHLMEISAPTDWYLHLYLIVSTLLFPLIFASDKEVLSRDKLHLRGSLANFVTRLESSFKDLSSLDNLMAFSSIMKKMINFHILISSRFKTSSIGNILKSIAADLRSDTDTLEEVIQAEIIKACNAFNWELFEENKLNPTDHAVIVQKIANAFMKSSQASIESILRLPESMTAEDFENPTYELSYNIFKIGSKVFHEVFLPQVLQLPMKLIILLLGSITNQLQNLSFRQFSEREHFLAMEVFRAWWIHLNTVHEYMGIVSGIIALNSCLF